MLRQLLTGEKAAGATGGAADQIQQLLGGSPGANVLSAAQPLFARNLADAQAQQLQFGTSPRFAANTAREGRLLSERALQDFNLFSQNVVENALGRNLGFFQNLLGTSGQVGAQQGQNQSALLAQLLDAALKGGGVTTPPTFMQQPSTLGNIASILGAVAPFALAPFTGGGSAALPGLLGVTSDRSPLAIPRFGSSVGRSLSGRNF